MEEIDADRRICAAKCKATWTDAAFRARVGWRLGYGVDCDRTAELRWRHAGTRVARELVDPVQWDSNMKLN